MDYEKILELASDEKVELAKSFKDEINKTLALGMTRYVCRHGTLSEGHGKLTDSQIYYQSIKEMWGLSGSIESQKVISMRAQADLMDAEDKLSSAVKKSEILRAEADILDAKTKLTNALVTIQDQTRMLDEFNKVRLELKEKVEAQYPLGIEQAEPDNWKAVYKYKVLQKRAGYQEILAHVPLPKKEKTELGLDAGFPEAASWMATTDQNELELLISNKQAMLNDKRNNK